MIKVPLSIFHVPSLSPLWLPRSRLGCARVWKREEKRHFWRFIAVYCVRVCVPKDALNPHSLFAPRSLFCRLPLKKKKCRFFIGRKGENRAADNVVCYFRSFCLLSFPSLFLSECVCVCVPLGDSGVFFALFTHALSLCQKEMSRLLFYFECERVLSAPRRGEWSRRLVCEKKWNPHFFSP